MSRRFWLLSGLAATGVLGCMFFPKGGTPEPTTTVLAQLALPDLDEDGKAEQLAVRTTNVPGAQAIQLDATVNPRAHDMVTSMAKAPLRFEKQGDRWLLLDADDAPVARVQLHQVSGAKTPNLLVFAGNQAKRFVFIDRGFLKLDAHEMIPGFSVGLVMLGDRAAFLEALGGAPAPDGRWQVPLAEPMTLKVQLNQDQRVVGITYDAEALNSRHGLKVGLPVAKLDGVLPGKVQADHWSAPRYGVIGHIGDDRRIDAITVRAPWREETR